MSVSVCLCMHLSVCMSEYVHMRPHSRAVSFLSGLELTDSARLAPRILLSLPSQHRGYRHMHHHVPVFTRMLESDLRPLTAFLFNSPDHTSLSDLAAEAGDEPTDAQGPSLMICQDKAASLGLQSLGPHPLSPGWGQREHSRAREAKHTMSPSQESELGGRVSASTAPVPPQACFPSCGRRSRILYGTLAPLREVKEGRRSGFKVLRSQV